MDEKKKIVVVDDEPLVAQLCRHVLSVEGHHVTTARTGEAALDLVEADKADLMLIDLRLPGINGWDTFRAARRRCPDICAVLMTGYGSKETVVAALKAGFDDFLDKPFTSDQLVLVVQQVLERRSEKAALAQAQKLLEAERDLLEAFISADSKAQVSFAVLTAARAVPGAAAALILDASDAGYRILTDGDNADAALLSAQDLNGIVGKGPFALNDSPLQPFFAASGCSHAVMEQVVTPQTNWLMCVGGLSERALNTSVLHTIWRIARLTEKALQRMHA